MSASAVMAFAVPEGIPQRPVHCNNDEKRHTGRTKLADRAGLVQPVRIDHGDRLRQFRFGDVMIDHDHIQTCLGGGGKRRKGGCPAIDRNDEANACILELHQRRGVRPVALGNSVRHINRHVPPDGAEELGQKCARARAVDIVIGKHADLLSRIDRRDDTLDRTVHIQQV
jgi:hypothetical protein